MILSDYEIILIATLPEKIQLKGYYDRGYIELNNVELKPEKSQAVLNHSPDGFKWGYCGSGPNQLSLSILLEYLPIHLALYSYKEFTRDFISKLDKKEDLRSYNFRKVIAAIFRGKTKRY